MKSYAKQQSIGRSRIKELKKAGVRNNAVKTLEAELDAFYKKHNLKKRGVGISFDSRMTKEERREMSAIVTNFLNDPTSTKSGIKKEAVGMLGDAAPTNLQDAAAAVDMGNVVLLSDQAIAESLQSDVVHDIYAQQKEEGYDPDAARYAMSRYAIENRDTLEGKTVDQIVKGINEYIDATRDIMPEWFDDLDVDEW